MFTYYIADPSAEDFAVALRHVSAGHNKVIAAKRSEDLSGLYTLCHSESQNTLYSGRKKDPSKS